MRGNFTTDRKGINNPNYKHGLRKTRLFSIWTNMLTRCNNTKSYCFHRYGGRGITVCEEWINDFKSFYDWSISNGYTDDLSIDRIDNDGNYEPSNCRWVNNKKQASNRSSNHLITINGETKTITQWSEIYKINRCTINSRIVSGWNEIMAVTTPVEIKFRRKVKL